MNLIIGRRTVELRKQVRHVVDDVFSEVFITSHILLLMLA